MVVTLLSNVYIITPHTNGSAMKHFIHMGLK